MKLFLCLALCAFATALPSVEVDPTAIVPETPETDAPYLALMEASHNDAQSTITQLLQEGKDDSACRDLAKATADEVTAAVKTQQKDLADMDNGDSCDKEGQGLIDTANQNKVDADKAKYDAQQALTAAKSKKFNFGDFAYDDLQEGQCGTFFNSQTWKDAKGKVTAAQSAYNTKVAEANAAAKAVTTAKDEAADLVRQCKCKAKKALDSALENMNKNAKAANTKAWNKAYHMQCVLDGKTTNNCNVPTLPIVQAVPYGNGVAKSCNRFKFISGAQTILGASWTCNGVQTTGDFTQCTGLTVNGYPGFQNGVSCSQQWMSGNPSASNLKALCKKLTGTDAGARFHYGCNSGQTRATWRPNQGFSTQSDNGYVNGIECHYRK